MFKLSLILAQEFRNKKVLLFVKLINHEHAREFSAQHQETETKKKKNKIRFASAGKSYMTSLCSRLGRTASAAQVWVRSLFIPLLCYCALFVFHLLERLSINIFFFIFKVNDYHFQYEEISSIF